ncbi:hypothetical protein [Thermococcus sp.]
MKRGIKLLAGSVLFLMLLIPTVTADRKVVNGVNVVTSVSPGRGDFFISVSTYGIIAHPLNFTLGGTIIHGSVIPTEIIFEDSLPDWMFLFYVSNKSYYIWSGNYLDYLGISPPAAFYSNGSWYLFLYGGALHIMINDRPLSKVYPYNLSLNNPMIFEIKNGCIMPTSVAPYTPVTHGRVKLENGKLAVSFPGEGRVMSIPLSSFEGYFHIVNATAFAESLQAAMLKDSAVILYFPAVSYFLGNNTTYAGIFRGNEFVSIFESKEMTHYVFLFRKTLKAIPVLNVGHRIIPLIHGTYGLRACNGTAIPSNNTTSNPVASGSPENTAPEFLLTLISGILIGIGIGYKVRGKRG